MQIPHYFPAFLVMLLGTLDCATTIIGTMHFGATEMNPILANTVANSPFTFMLIKLAATMGVVTIFVFLDYYLSKNWGRSFDISRKIVDVAYAGIIIFLALTVMNNILVLVYGLQMM